MKKPAATLAVGLLSFLIALLLYRATLLPGLDLGDTPSFQVMAGEPVITPRDAYPLYFGIGRLAVAIHGGDRAQALNLATAVEAALACAIAALVAYELAGSAAAALAAALLFAGSYTFWSQAIIAEVYALHVLFVALTLLLLLRWARQPTFARFVLFVGTYALGFGNHLTMALLAPPYVLFLLWSAPAGWRSVVNRRNVAATLALTVLASLQYAWNFNALWLAPLPPESLLAGLGSFWFDVTKSDWRQAMVATLPLEMTGERLRMYAFDLWQQFGWIGPPVAVAGVLHLLKTQPARAWLLLLIYAITVAFAVTYNVGDTHVFFLPSHLVVALLAAPGIVWCSSLVRVRAMVPIVAAAVLGTAAVRIYTDFPALDRSGDTRPAGVLSELTTGLDDQQAILLTDMNWQLENGLNYFAQRSRPELAYTPLSKVLPYAQALVRDNVAVGREVALSERAATSLASSYGATMSVIRDDRIGTPSIADVARSIPRGSRYVVCVLRPTRDVTIDAADLAEGLRTLAADSVSAIDDTEFAVVAGTAGRRPTLVERRDRPFRRTVLLDGVDVTIRMDSWLEFDTIRRMGFGHVIARRHHTLIVERGVSLVAFDESGVAFMTAYWANIFAAQPGYLVRLRPS